MVAALKIPIFILEEIKTPTSFLIPFLNALAIYNIDNVQGKKILAKKTES